MFAMKILARYRVNFISAHKLFKKLRLYIDTKHCQQKLHLNVMNATSVDEGWALEVMEKNVMTIGSMIQESN